MKTPPTHVAASVRARLSRLSKERGEDFQLLLTRYANERLLYRVAVSPHGRRFVIKGATLFMIWTGKPHRATRDVDLLAQFPKSWGAPSTDQVREVFEAVLAAPVPEDGVVFDSATLDVGLIRETQVYGGIRVAVLARIGAAKLKLQVDIGFGDAVTPEPVHIAYPVLLDFPAPELPSYPRETVVAEKLEAMTQLGMANSRMKDFYDIFVLARDFEFDGSVLARAITATFARRRTALPQGTVTAFTEAFASDKSKQAQWAGFVRKSAASDAHALEEVIAHTKRFLAEPLRAAGSSTPFDKHWSPGGPWQSPASGS